MSAFIPSRSYIANHVVRCLKANGPLGFSLNEPFTGPGKLSAAIASWCIWLRPAVSCPSIETKEKDVFAHGDDRPLSSFAGVFL